MQRNPVFYIIPILKVILKRLVYWGASIIPKSHGKIVMGAWGGHLFLDNPMYLLHYLHRNTRLRIIWIGEQDVADKVPVSERCQFARRGTLKAVWHLLTSATWVCTHSHCVDLTDMAIPRGVQCINLWHGIPIKRLGKLQAFRNVSTIKDEVVPLTRRIYQKLSAFPREWLVVSSDKMIDIMVDGNPSQYDRQRILRTGTPRNDYLIHNRANRVLQYELKQKYGKLLGFDTTKIVVLYLPTWRERSNELFSFFGLPIDEQKSWKDFLEEKGAVLIEKYHHASFERLPPPKNSLCSYVVKTEQEGVVNAQEMLLMADILISDYSGAYIDFSLLQRPVIHFTYDYEYYACNDDGFAYDLNSVLAGRRVDTLAELQVELTRQIRHPDFYPQEGLQEVVHYEHGHSCELLAEFITGHAKLRAS